MITIKQRSGETVIFGTNAERLIERALKLLIEFQNKTLGEDSEYTKSVLTTIQN